MQVSFQGFHEQVLTLEADGVQAGEPVRLKANGTVCACAAGDVPIGVAAAQERGGCVGVQMAGYVRLPYAGAAPALGYGLLAADGAGGVKAAENGGRPVVVLDVDEQAHMAGIVL